jgi:hypothetical protein
MEIQILNKYKKQILYTIVGVIALYFLIQLATCSPKMPADLKASIDSLTVANKRLMKSQEHMDSTITTYKTKIDQIDIQIDNIKNKTTVINRYYTNLGQKVDHYDATQVDSFFKSRYNY